MSSNQELQPLPSRASEASARSILKIGACTSAAGIALAVTGDNDVARWLTVVGLVLLVWGLHRFGRLGVDGGGDHGRTP